MAKVKNETTLMIAVVKQKAVDKKRTCSPEFRNGIDWALDRFDEVVISLEER